MKSGCRSCALVAASTSALGLNHRKITHTSTSRWAVPVRSSAPIALRYSASIRAWAHTKLIRQVALTVTGTELKSSNAASFVRERAHLTTTAAGVIAREANVRRVEPFHFSPRYAGEQERMLAEVMTAFQGSHA